MIALSKLRLLYNKFLDLKLIGIVVTKQWLCSSMVEQATHNRQVTGSNPVGAILFLLLVSFLTLPVVKAEEQTLSKPSDVAPGLNEFTYPQPADAPATLPKDFIPLDVNQFRMQITAPMDRKLRGPGAELIGISRDITLLNDGADDKRPCHGCVAVRVRIINESTEPIMVDGNNARAIAANQEVLAWSEEKVLKTSGAELSGKQKLALAAFGLGTFGLGEPILQDYFTTSKKTLLKSYGDIVIRRRFENNRLSKRIILPNEDTYASVIFPSASFPFQKVVIPLLNYPGGEPCGSLTVDTSKSDVK